MTNFFSFKSISFAAAAAVAASGLTLTAAHAGEVSPATVVKPKAGLSFPIGSKQAVGYFLAENGGCDLTLLVGEAGEAVSDGEKSAAAARFSTLIGLGRTARIDAADGHSVEFFCSTGASVLTTRVIDRVAYSKAAK